MVVVSYGGRTALLAVRSTKGLDPTRIPLLVTNRQSIHVARATKRFFNGVVLSPYNRSSTINTVIIPVLLVRVVRFVSAQNL